MKKYFNKLVAVMMVLVLSLLGTSVAYAQNNNSNLLIQEKDLLNGPKSNYNYIKGQLGDTDTIYTYTNGNKTFKVVENASEDFDRVDSTIYIEYDNKEFVEYATQKFRVVNNEIVITINENGKITTDKIKINNKENTSVINKLPAPPDSILDAQAMLASGGPTWDGFPVSSWEYYGEFNGSADVYKYTAAAVLAALTTLVASFFGLAGRMVVAGASTVAGMIVQGAIERIWYTTNVYYQTVIPPEEWMFRRKVAEYSHIYVFKSSDKTGANLTGDYYKYYYDPLYVE